MPIDTTESVGLPLGIVQQLDDRYAGLESSEPVGAFPSSPVSGDRVFRSDLGHEYYYDGTRWLSTQLFTQPIAIFSAAVSASTNYYTPVPFLGVHSLWLDSWTMLAQRSAAGEWDVTLNHRAADSTITTLDTRDGSADADALWLNFVRPLGVVLPSTARIFHYLVTEVSGAANYIGGGSINYRLIGA